MSIDGNTKVMTQEMTGDSCRSRATASTRAWVAERPPLAWLAKLVLAATLIQATPGIAQQSDFTTAPVTPDMTLAAMQICVGQLHAGAFDADALTGVGWVVAVSADGDPVIRGYRHPDNMIMLTTFDGAGGNDKCVVMAPVGQGMSLQDMRAAIAAQPNVRSTRAGDATRWAADGLSFELKPMGGAGVVIEIEARKS